MFFFSAGTSSLLPNREESGLGVTEYHNFKETLKKNQKELVLSLRKKNVSLLANIPP